MKRLFMASLLILSVALLGLPAFGQSTIEKANVCSLSAFIDGVTATTQLVAAPALTTTTVNINGVPTAITSGSFKLKICNISIRINQTATPANFGLAYGTGTNCGTGTTNLTPQWTGTASIKNDTWESKYGPEAPLVVPAGKAVCLRLSATPTGAQAMISYKLEP